MAGPTLAGVATSAQQIVTSPDYKGKARDAAGYIRESIVELRYYRETVFRSPT